ncbi:DapH/DapD/GlmU-related protein [Providencia stuartii]|uniref:serine O-acetyltransferase n=1 Tax=Providencia TaxID=586 RepID=UPI00234BE560|nr:DapH/DapD/GlmU-related protein [Providencia sp. PROV271]
MKPIDYIKSDLGRYIGQDNVNIKNIVSYYIRSISFRFSFWFRLCQSKNKIIKVIAIFNHRRLSRKYMLDIPRNAKIGYGLYIGHGGSIVVNPTTVIGDNVNLSQFTTIGSNYGKAATIGDNVYIGPNVCIVEDVVIGNESKIGAGSVVTKDVDSNSVYVGVPAKKVKTIEYNDLVARKYTRNK